MVWLKKTVLVAAVSLSGIAHAQSTTSSSSESSTSSGLESSTSSGLESSTLTFTNSSSTLSSSSSSLSSTSGTAPPASSPAGSSPGGGGAASTPASSGGSTPSSAQSAAASASASSAPAGAIAVLSTTPQAFNNFLDIQPGEAIVSTLTINGQAVNYVIVSQGCRGVPAGQSPFADGTGPESGTAFTPGSCAATCAGKGASMSGAQRGICNCGNTLRTDLPLIAPAQCKASNNAKRQTGTYDPVPIAQAIPASQVAIQQASVTLSQSSLPVVAPAQKRAILKRKIEDVAKRQTGAVTYVGRAGSPNPTNCQQASVFRLGASGTLTIDGAAFGVNPGVFFAPLRTGQTGSIVATFTAVTGSGFAWTNPSFFGGQAGFCQDATGQVYATFANPAVAGNVPSGCTTVSFNVIPTTSSGAVTTVAPNPGTIGDYASLGCFSSGGGFPSFLLVKQDNALTIDSCIAACGGSKLIGVFGTDCYCGSFIDNSQTQQVSENQCNTQCPGNPLQRCGGRSSVAKRQAVPAGVLLSIYIRIDAGSISTVVSVSVSAGIDTTASFTFTTVVTDPGVTVTAGVPSQTPNVVGTLTLPPGLYTEGQPTPTGEFCRITTGSWYIGSTTLLPFPLPTA
ncbi:hypothetical protein K4K56_007558 [Colletotrichum sp. SAR 10_98]|nr:hypothetical protein K4K56_007558 [Colletotrichum sp. SAR 10_98]